MKEPSAAPRGAGEGDPDELNGLGAVAAAWRVGGRDYLPYRITLLAKLLDRCTTRLLSESSGLSVAEWRVLPQLARASPQSVRRLAEQAWVDRAEVSRAAASLERRGYLERRENARDRRSPLLYCTPKGAQLFHRIAPSRQQFHKSLTDLLTPAQIAELEAAMVVLARQCVDELEGAAPDETSPRRAGRRR